MHRPSQLQGPTPTVQNVFNPHTSNLTNRTLLKCLVLRYSSSMLKRKKGPGVFDLQMNHAARYELLKFLLVILMGGGEPPPCAISLFVVWGSLSVRGTIEAKRLFGALITVNTSGLYILLFFFRGRCDIHPCLSLWLRPR